MSGSAGTPEQGCPLNEQAVGWALHALEPDEEMAVLLHLPQCRSCRAAVHTAETVMSGLAGTVEQVEPPPSLRDALLARAMEARPQRQGLPRPRPDSSQWRPALPAHPQRHRAEEPGPAPVEPPGRAEPPPSRAAGLPRRGRVLVAASLVLVALLSIGGLLARTIQLQQQRDAQTAQAQSLTDLLQRLGRPGSQHALLSTDTGTTVAAVLVGDGEVQVFPVGLPSNATDRAVYVLWGLAADRAPRPLGTFDVAASHPGPRPVGTIPEVDTYNSYAISLEPGRAAPPAPSGVMASGGVAT